VKIPSNVTGILEDRATDRHQCDRRILLQYVLPPAGFQFAPYPPKIAWYHRDHLTGGHSQQNQNAAWHRTSFIQALEGLKSAIGLSPKLA